MGENNEYYAKKMRHLLDEQKRREATSGFIEAGNGAKGKGGSGQASDFDFSTKRPPRKEIPREKVIEPEAETEVKKKSKKEIALTVLLSFAALIIGLFCVYKVLFVINTITVVGANTYTDEQIIASSLIKKGDNLYSFNSRIAGENIKLYCPCVKEVSVKRTPLGKIELTVVEEKPVFYALIYGEYRGLTGDLRVLGTLSEEEREGLIKLKLPAIKKAIAGEAIVTEDSSLTYINDVIKAVFEAELLTRIKTADVRYSYDIRLTCDGKYILSLGDYQDAAVKLKIAASVLKDQMFGDSNKATLDLSDITHTGVVIDNQLEID